MRSGKHNPLCAIEDWSGAGFHTKQPLNVGQPTVSQVVSSPNNQSCLDPSPVVVVVVCREEEPNDTGERPRSAGKRAEVPAPMCPIRPFVTDPGIHHGCRRQIVTTRRHDGDNMWLTVTSCHLAGLRLVVQLRPSLALRLDPHTTPMTRRRSNGQEWQTGKCEQDSTVMGQRSVWAAATPPRQHPQASSQ